MKILVINTGSSSIKYQLFDMAAEEVLASGIAERIGEAAGMLRHRRHRGGGTQEKHDDAVIPTHQEGMQRIAALLVDSEHGVMQDRSEVSAVGHRVVHGGERFQSSTRIDETVLAAIKENIPLAPLHNPANLTGIAVARSIFPEAPHVAVFDTAFHQTVPERAYLYALPLDLYEKHHVRRYGFHGTSHAYVSKKAAEYVGRPLNELNLITIHLGNGASMAALRKGACVDTTMGMTPLEGLVMGTRSGDVDPAIPFFLAADLGMSLQEIDALLNKESGLKGLCGTNDMREVIERKDKGDKRAETALDVYAYRVKKYIGAYFAALGQLDLLVFTAGIGENAPEIRGRCCRGLENLGIALDEEKNISCDKGVREIGSAKCTVRVLVVPTNEELEIARQTKMVVESLGSTQ